jgi:hypothetical protein
MDGRKWFIICILVINVNLISGVTYINDTISNSGCYLACIDCDTSCYYLKYPASSSNKMMSIQYTANQTSGIVLIENLHGGYVNVVTSVNNFYIEYVVSLVNGDYWSDVNTVVIDGPIIEICNNNHGCCLGNPCTVYSNNSYSYTYSFSDDMIFTLTDSTNNYMSLSLYKLNDTTWLNSWVLTLGKDMFNFVISSIC